MSWFVGKQNKSRGGKYIVTETHPNRRSPDMEYINTLQEDMITASILEKYATTRNRADSAVSNLGVSGNASQQSADCDLTDVRDQTELIDAVKKLLRYTELSVERQREVVSDLKYALFRLSSNMRSITDKSLVTSVILREADNLTLPDDTPKILPIVRKLIAVIDI